MVTIKDIARVAGVNISTVSRALHGSELVSEDTRRQIRQIAKDMGYRPDISARAMVGKKTHLIGVVVPEVGSDYYAQSVYAFEKELKKKGYSITVCTDGFNIDQTFAIIDLLMSRKVDGIIYHSMFDKEVVEHIQKNRSVIPAVLISENPVGQQVNSVIFNYQTGYEKAFDLFRGCGHTRIAHIGENLTFTRLDNILKICKDNECSISPEHVFIGPERFELGGYLRMKELLAAKNRPTAILAAYDAMAFGAMKAAAEMSVSIPGDISIIGFDNIRASAFMNPALTTIAPSIGTVARTVVDMMLQRIEDKDTDEGIPRCVRHDTELIVRESVAVVRS